MAAGYCSVCRSNVRGSYAAHAGTARHRARLVTAENRRGNRAVGSKAATRRGNAGRSLRTNADAYLRAITARVRKYRRSRPNDGTRRVVPVAGHYRRKPTPRAYVARKLHQLSGAWYVFTYRDGTATGAMRRATRREAQGATEGMTL